ncbi:MAG: dihydropteroate synthase [Thermoleophilia bacterium]|nr:dihydropteroate synthase [Thermoleophilia bacterium]
MIPVALGPDPWLVMGILNVTPDSFHDGGRFASLEAAVARAGEMAAAGAGIIDVGGESTRPGSMPVDAGEELRRAIPVIQKIAPRLRVPVSIDTRKAAVAREALRAGAAMINDVTALRDDPEMAAVAAAAGCPVCLMHMLGEPGTMQDNPRYEDVVGDIISFFEERVRFAVSRGIRRENIIIDPGMGFGKTVQHNLEILRRLDEFLALGLPLMIGASRKSFIGKVTGEEETGKRLAGTIATTVASFQRGARVFRVHDVAENVQALKIAEAIRGAR